MNVCVIIPAAGSSTRFGAVDKLSQDLGGRPLLIRSVEPFTRHDLVRSIIVAGPPDEEAFAVFKDRFGPTLGFHGATLVPGGQTARWETVLRALEHVPEDTTHVAVHDAARPLVRPGLLDRLFDAATSLAAVIPTVEVTSTVRRVSEETSDASTSEPDAIAEMILGDAGRSVTAARRVLETVDRANLVAVQTPQVFEVALLRRAYSADDRGGATDDACLVERLGEPVFAIAGDARNIKVTTPEDLEIVRALDRATAPDKSRTF